MRVPEVADRLRELAAEWGKPELLSLAGHLRRRRPVHVAEPVSEPMTEELRDKIRAYDREKPGQAQAVLAKRFNVNIGRISEALRGFRH